MSTDKPRVLCLMQLPPPVHGAAVINEAIATSSLLASRFDLEVIPLRFASSLGDIGRLSARKLVRTVTTSIRIARSVKRKRPAAMYLPLSLRGGAFYRDCVYIAIAKAFGLPRIFHLHTRADAESRRTGWKHRLGAWALRDAWVIQLSPLLDDDLGSLVPGERLLHVANGVADYNRLGATGRADAAGPVRVLFIANMREDKGPLVLVEALSAIAKRGVAFEATFAGADLGDGCVDAFNAAVERFGLRNRVRYLGAVYGDAKHELLATHDVFAYPTSNDAFPLVVLEAMQWGLPVVSTVEGAMPEIIEDGASGYLVPAGDIAALADRLEALLLDRTLRLRLGTRGRERYAELYTLKRFEERLERAWERCVGAAM